MACGLATFQAAWPFNVISTHAGSLNEIHLSVEAALYYHMPKVNWQEPAARFHLVLEKS